MQKDLLVSWLEQKIHEFAEKPINVSNTEIHRAYLHGVVRTLEIVKERVESGEFDVES